MRERWRDTHTHTQTPVTHSFTGMNRQVILPSTTATGGHNTAITHTHIKHAYAQILTDTGSFLVCTPNFEAFGAFQPKLNWFRTCKLFSKLDSKDNCYFQCEHQWACPSTHRKQKASKSLQVINAVINAMTHLWLQWFRSKWNTGWFGRFKESWMEPVQEHIPCRNASYTQTYTHTLSWTSPFSYTPYTHHICTHSTRRRHTHQSHRYTQSDRQW